MRKGLTILIGIIIIFLVSCQLFLPPIVGHTLARKAEAALSASVASAEVTSTVAPMLLLGRFDTIKMEAKDAMLGKVRTARLALKGENVSVDLGAIQDGRFAIRAADRFEIDATITEHSLAELLRAQVDRVQDINVTVRQDVVVMDGKVKLIGQLADVHLEGRVLEDDNHIWFRIMSIKIMNARLGRGITGRLFSDIELMDFGRLGLPVTLDRIEQTQGEIRLYASRHAK